MSLDFNLYTDVDVGNTEPERVYWFERGITHNLTTMAKEANIYLVLWRPDELPQVEYAEDILPVLEKGLTALLLFPEHYNKFNAENGWGTYADFVDFVKEVVKACKQYPKTEIEISR
jgi:hypothetical protein